MTENQAREEICRVGESLFARGYVHASAGNISIRLDDSEGGGLLMTPTDACLGFLDPARLAKMDSDGQQLGGDKASKTLRLHRSIYSAARAFDPETACVIHTHSTHCVAVSLHASGPELLPALTPYFVMKVGHVPMIAYQRPGSDKVVAEVAQVIAAYGQQGRPVRAVMLARLGPQVWHASAAAAMAVLEELEETAKLWMMCQSGPGLQPLDDTQIQELRDLFQARW